MIVYGQGSSHLYQTLFRIHGSALYKGLFPAMISTGVLLILEFTSSEPNAEIDTRWFSHPYPIATLIAAFTFLLTFKTSFSYNRYWEACTALHQMHSKWLDTGIELAAWHLQSKRFGSIRPPSFGEYPHLDSVVRKRERKDRMTPQRLKVILDDDLFHEDGVDHASVAIESSRTRSWWKKMKQGRSTKRKLETESVKEDKKASVKSINSISSTRRQIKGHGFKRYDSMSPKPNNNSFRTPDNRSDRFRLSKIISVANLDGGMEDMSPSLFLQEASHLISLLSAVAFSTLRNDLQKAPSPLAEYTVGSPWPSVDPDQFTDDKDSQSYYEMSNARKLFNYLLGNQRSAEQRTIYNACRPFRVLGGVSDAEIDLLQSARGPLAKTALVTMWLQEFISREFEKGALGKTPPPVVSRLYQFVSDGMIGYNQARKVAYIPFPFAHTQLTTFYVVVVMFLLPILMLTFVHEVIMAAILNGLTVGVFVGLWQVSNELEDPFRNVPNDLPLNYFQAEFNEALVVMFAGYHPESWWDVGENMECITGGDLEGVDEKSADVGFVKEKVYDLSKSK